METPAQGFEVLSFTSAREFLSVAGDHLYAQEDSVGLMLGLAEAFQKNDLPYRAWVVTKNGAIQFLASQTPPYGLVFAQAPDMSPVRFFAEQLAASVDSESIPSFVGPVHETQIFARVWAQKTGRQIDETKGFRQRIYRADEVRPVKNPFGEMIVADLSQLELATDFSHAFVQEAVPSDDRGRDFIRQGAEKMIQAQRLFFWKAGGKIVAQTAVSRPTKSGITVSYVYTPTEARGKGFASALVAEVTRKQLADGKKFCVLYTDLANPTSNSIYSKIGYRPVCDSQMLVLK